MTSIQIDLEDPYRYSYFPIKYKSLENLYQDQLAVVWKAHEITYSNDRNDWESLDPKIKKMVEMILCLFAQIDGIINENLNINFKNETSFIKECKLFYSAQELIENVHNEVYSNFIETFILDEETRKKAYLSIRTIPSIKKLAEWMFRWMAEGKSLIYRLIASAFVEGVIFNEGFTVINWLKYFIKEKFASLIKGNEWIMRDERIHVLFAIELVPILTRDFGYTLPDETEIYDLAREVVIIAKELAEEIVPSDFDYNFSSSQLVTYCEMITDSILASFGYKKLFNASNPFTWMAAISLQNKSNFFETDVSEYSKSDKKDIIFDLNRKF